MKTTQEIQQELMTLLPESKVEVVVAIKKYFPKNSQIYREAVLIKARINSLRKKELQGTISVEEVQIEENKIRTSLMEIITSIGTMESIEGNQPNRKLLIWGTFVLLFITGIFVGWKYFGDDQPITGGGDLIDSISTMEIGDTLQRSVVAKSSPSKSPIGRVLYSVPNKMQLEKKTRCIIRIAQSELSTLKLVEGVDAKAPIEIDSIRIGDLMTAKITTAPGDNTFKIISLSTPEQIIEQDFVTEWLFDVVPLVEGIHSLFLKVTVKVKTQDFGVKERDIFVMDKEIEILSEDIDIGTPILEEGGKVMLASLTSPVNIEGELDLEESVEEPVEIEEIEEPLDIKAEDKVKNDPPPKTNNTTKSGNNNNSNNKGTGSGTTIKNVPIFTKGEGIEMVTIKGKLENRKVVTSPKVTANTVKRGKIALKVCVDKSGKVTDASFTQKGSTSSDIQLVRIAIANAKKWTFAKGKQPRECGILFYDFKQK
ncbi:hypothetical protein OAF63_05890 [Saprospiraceae bacterium]|nr:hypothetical protein [Saprospiraceae bacterium]